MSFYLAPSPTSMRSLISYDESERLSSVAPIEMLLDSPNNIERDLPPSYSRIGLATSLPSDIGSSLFHPLQPLHAPAVISASRVETAVDDPFDIPMTRSSRSVDSHRSSLGEDESSGRMDRQMRELLSLYTPHSGSRANTPSVGNTPIRSRRDVVVQGSHEARVAASIAASNSISVPERRRRYLEAMARLNGGTPISIPPTITPITPRRVGPLSGLDLVTEAMARPAPTSTVVTRTHRASPARRPARYDATEIRNRYSSHSDSSRSSRRSTPRQSRPPTPPPKDAPPVPPRGRARNSDIASLVSAARDSIRPPPPIRKDTGYAARLITHGPTHHTPVNPRRSYPARHSPSPPESLPVTPIAWPGENGTCPPPLPPKSPRDVQRMIIEARRLVQEVEIQRASTQTRRRAESESVPSTGVPPVPPRPTGPPEIHVPDSVYDSVRLAKRQAASCRSTLSTGTARQESSFTDATTLVASSFTPIPNRVLDHGHPAGSRRTQYHLESTTNHTLARAKTVSARNHIAPSIGGVSRTMPIGIGTGPHHNALAVTSVGPRSLPPSRNRAYSIGATTGMGARAPSGEV